MLSEPEKKDGKPRTSLTSCQGHLGDISNSRYDTGDLPVLYAEHIYIFFYKVMELVSGGSVLNGPTLSSYELKMHKFT